MKHTYNISGMTCGNCVAKAKSELLKLGDVVEADVQLSAPQATITMQKHIPLEQLQAALRKGGNYTITQANGMDRHAGEDSGDTSSVQTYKPILLVGAYIILITFLVEIFRPAPSWENWMQNFMAGFFLSFSFFKMLDLKGFAEGYATYDVIAKRWMGWGYVYAFIELLLGLSFLIKFEPLLTNMVTFVLMSTSLIGVLQSVLNRRKIRCACLGAVFNLPMSTVTIAEDVLMIAMSGWMIGMIFL